MSPKVIQPEVRYISHEDGRVGVEIKGDLFVDDKGALRMWHGFGTTPEGKEFDLEYPLGHLAQRALDFDQGESRRVRLTIEPID